MTRISSLLIFTLCVAGAAQATAQVKVGTVDMARLVKEYRRTKEAETQINEARNAAKKEFEERTDAYKKGLDEINKLNVELDAPALSTEARALKAKDRDEKLGKVRNTEREINEFRQTREQQLQQQLLRAREGIVKELTDIVLERVKAENLDLVFDKSGASLNGFSPLLFSRESTDFTAQIIAVLEKSGRAVASTGEPASNPARAVSPSPGPAKASKP